MKIEHINAECTDTDKLPDIDAQILEMSEQLRKLCEENQRPFAMIISPNGNERFLAFWNIMGKTNISEKGIDIGAMLACLNNLVENMTRGGMSLKANE